MRYYRKFIKNRLNAKQGMVKIPLHKFTIAGNELKYIAKAMENGHIAGDGQFSQNCSLFLEKKLKTQKILLTNSCTAALEMAAILCGLKLGDEVILPSFTFASVANVFCTQGAKLIFVDIRSDTLNLDENRIKEAITKRTKIIIPTHYAGIGCEMDTITKAVKNRGAIYIIEDAALGFNAKYKNKYLGTIGDFGAFSFHDTKTFSCGEGGALSINNDNFIERAEIIWQNGTNRSQFLKGKMDSYSWIDKGASYLLSDIAAAFLYAQLEKMDKVNNACRKIFDRYLATLTPLANRGVLSIPQIPRHCIHNSIIFYIILKDYKLRDSLMHYLNYRGIAATFHYVPLHLSPMGRSQGYTEGLLPVTETISKRLLRLPIYCGLTEEYQHRVIGCIYDFFKMAWPC